MPPQLIARLFIDGLLADERTLDLGGPVEQIAEMHKRMADEAGDRWWRLEITDPDGDIDPIIMSNRPDNMRVPIAVPLDEAITPEGFHCSHCGMTSHHPRDKVMGYCGNCHHVCADIDAAMAGWENVEEAARQGGWDDEPE